ncbi:hypothetical protein [Achromobacter insolitus]|uniref:hypothetical protein n=1 Tax=Achromobacter insolitus TaxID=217204 RepID=UPI002FE1FF7C
MTTKHTPGPWHYQPGRDSRPPYVIRGAEGGFVVVGMTAERQEADAALIAAAPELLAQAEKHLAWLSKLTDWAGADDPDLDGLRSAIAKAKGEQQ